MSNNCPNCGGTKSAELGNGMQRCLYCGTSFEMPHQQAPIQTPQPITPQQQPVMVVNNIGATGTQPITPVYIGGKNKGTAVILAFLLGCFGVARFYVGSVGLGLFYLFLTLIISAFSFGIGFFVIGSILSLIDFLYFLCMSESTFNRLYNRQYNYR